MNSALTSLPLAGIPAEDEALRPQVRAFLSRALRDLPADVRSRSWLGFELQFSRSLAKEGWIGLTLPREYGGAGRSSFARFVLSEELLTAGAPVAAHWFADRQTAPLILRYGTPAQLEFFLPRIARADVVFCIGMSEPDTGSDLASVRTRATRTEGGWLLNGRKIWTTNAHRADYMLALVRTSGTIEDRHNGLSQIVVDMKRPGVRVRPLRDIAGDAHFNEVLFEDVELPADALIGEEGAGWQQVTAELALERSGPERLYSSIVLAEAWLAEMRAVAAEHPVVRSMAGRIAGRLAVLRAMSLAVAAKLVRYEKPDLEAALVKDLDTEFEQPTPEWIREALDTDAPHYDAYECSDGRWISIGPIEARFHADLVRRLRLELDDIGLPGERDAGRRLAPHSPGSSGAGRATSGAPCWKAPTSFLRRCCRSTKRPAIRASRRDTLLSRWMG